MTTPSATLDPRDVQDMLTFTRQLDKADHTAGWGSLSEEEVIANAPLLLSILEQRDKCSRCPGLQKCKDDHSMPRATVARKLWIVVDAKEQARIRAAYGPCALIAEMRRQARDDAAEAAGQKQTKRRRREESSDGGSNEHIPF